MEKRLYEALSIIKKHCVAQGDTCRGCQLLRCCNSGCCAEYNFFDDGPCDWDLDQLEATVGLTDAGTYPETLNYDPEDIENISETELEKVKDKFLYAISMNEETGFLEILPMNGNCIIIHGENEARFFIDLILDHF